MKKLILSASFAFALLTTTNTFAQQGFGTNQPDKSAAVDIVSSKRGLLIPRISIEDLDQAAPVSNPATSLFVYNTNTTSGEGFYYWDGSKWVRFTSSINEKNVIVTAGDNVQVDPTTSPDGLTTTYKVGVQGGSKDGQVLVTKVDGATTTTEWVDPNDFVLDALTAGNAIGIALDVNGDIEIKFNGTLSEDTTIATGPHDLAITGLGAVNAMTADDKLVIMDENGLLKTISKTDLVDAKNLTSTGGIITLNGAAAVNNSVLAGVELGIADRSIDPGKFKAEDTDEGKVPVVKNDGTVEWTTIPGTNSAALSTDGKIVIGDNTSITQTLPNAVLVPTQLSIAAESITSGEIKNGTIKAEDIYAPNSSTDNNLDGDINQVMVTDENGNVSWINQSALGNKDSYTGIGAIDITANGNSTNGINYDVSVATATGTTLGVVKEAETDPTVNVVDGVLSVNLAKTTLSGDVTGPLNATVVEAIQGTDVSATPPTATNNVLKYVEGTGGAAGQWVPSQLQGTDVAGKAITSTSLTVSADGVTAALKDVTIEITPGTEGQILTTTNTGTITDPVLSTNWATPNSLVAVDNGLNKADGDVIHLGGTLKEVTDIKTSSTNTLAISGLTIPAGESEIVYTQAADGILRKVARSISDEITATQNVNSVTGYNDFVQEINISATIGAEDLDVVLPAASAANKGQVVNIKIANLTEPDYYLNIKVGSDTLTYGAMPHQGWIVKSNGSDWVIVGRN